MRMTDHQVLIVGGGPTGLMLAGELAIAGVDVAVVERRADQELDGWRAGGLHARTLEVFDQRGIADRFIARGKSHPAVSFHIPLDMTDCPTRYNYVLALGQGQIEGILAEWVDQMQVTIHRGRVVEVKQDEAGGTVVLDDGRSMQAAYIVGCDGGRSIVRNATGIGFPGWDATTSWLNAEVEMREEPRWGFHHDRIGRHAIGRVDETARVRVVLTEPQVGSDQPTLRNVSAALVDIYGTDFGVNSPTWISRFTDATRQAASYRDRRVLLAGDAAHIHPPLGGQGLNIGIQDAVNLGWKLAQVVKGISSDSLLDSYHAERHPVGARVLRYTMALVGLRRTDERSNAVCETMSELLLLDEARRMFAAEMSGLNVRYDLGEGHPLLGRRMPDLDVFVDGQPFKVFRLLENARPLLLKFGAADSVDIRPWVDRVHVVHTRYDGAWTVPALGVVIAPSAVLVRPDGYVAWAGNIRDEKLITELTTWFGAPAAAAN